MQYAHKLTHNNNWSRQQVAPSWHATEAGAGTYREGPRSQEHAALQAMAANGSVAAQHDMPAREAGQEASQPLTSNLNAGGSATAKAPIQRYVHAYNESSPNKQELYYNGSVPSTSDKEKIENTITRYDSGFAYSKTQSWFSFKYKQIGGNNAEVKDTEHVHFYKITSTTDQDSGKTTNSKTKEATLEISDIVDDYNVKVACVLQALIAKKGTVSSKSTAEDLHDHLRSTSPDYSYYDLDEVYPQLYGAEGLTATVPDKDQNSKFPKLEDLVESLTVGTKYIMEAQSASGGAGHNFCIKVKTVGSGNSAHKAYDALEDKDNAHARDDVRIVKYWT